MAIIPKNIVTDFGAVGNDIADDAPKFMDFNAWALVNQGSDQIVLTIPPGTYKFDSTPNTWASGVKDMIGSGYSAALHYAAGAGGSAWLGGTGVLENSTTNALIATVLAGSSTVQLLTPAQHTRFTVGRYVAITAGDLQGAGFPPNAWWFEYRKVLAIDTGTGVITLDAPLAYDYKSTWPAYSGSSWLGGPATLYALSPLFDTHLEYQGPTINSDVVTYANGRLITWTDCEWIGAAVLAPTTSITTTLNNCTVTADVMECDKLVSNLVINGGTFDTIQFQSSSILNFTATNVVADFMTGTPTNTTVSGGSIGQLIIGATNYGRSKQAVFENVAITTIRYPPGNVHDINVDTRYTISSGVIAAPFADSGDVRRWAIPGTHCFLGIYNGSIINEGYPFTVVDVVRSGSDILVTTTLTNTGWPAIPVDGTAGLAIFAHPMPSCRFINCTGGDDAIDFSQFAAAPLFSNSSRTYTGNIGTAQANIPGWGSVQSITIDVTRAYTGVQSSLTLHALSQFGCASIVSGAGPQVNYDPTVNLKIAGTRTITPSGNTGAQSGDSLPSLGDRWFCSTHRPYVGTDISAEVAGNPLLGPIVTITVNTDQGITPDNEEVAAGPRFNRNRGRQQHIYSPGAWGYGR